MKISHTLPFFKCSIDCDYASPSQYSTVQNADLYHCYHLLSRKLKKARLRRDGLDEWIAVLIATEYRWHESLQPAP